MSATDLPRAVTDLRGGRRPVTTLTCPIFTCVTLAAVHRSGGAVQDRLDHADLPVDRHIVPELAGRAATLEEAAHASRRLVVGAAHLLRRHRLGRRDDDGPESVGEMPRDLEQAAEGLARVALEIELREGRVGLGDGALHDRLDEGGARVEVTVERHPPDIRRLCDVIDARIWIHREQSRRRIDDRLDVADGIGPTPWMLALAAVLLLAGMAGGRTRPPWALPLQTAAVVLAAIALLALRLDAAVGGLLVAAALLGHAA